MFFRIITCAVAALALVSAAGFTAAEAGEVQMSFHGNQHFRFVSNDGKVIPQHVRYKGGYPWMGTGKQYEAEVKKLGLDVNVLIPTPGKVYTLSK